MRPSPYAVRLNLSIRDSIELLLRTQGELRLYALLEWFDDHHHTDVLTAIGVMIQDKTIANVTKTTAAGDTINFLAWRDAP